MKFGRWRGVANPIRILTAMLVAMGSMLPRLGWSYDTSGAEAPAAAVAPPRPEDGSSGSRSTQRYASVAIVQPHEQATVHDNNDSLAVELAVAPPLEVEAGDQFVFMVDGAAAAIQTGNRFQLSNVVRGTHTAQALVVDRNGQTLVASTPVTFYMWHASALFPNRAR